MTVNDFDILDNFIGGCDSTCVDIGQLKDLNKMPELQKMHFMARNLPALDYVVEMFSNYMFSNGLTTGDEQQDVKLKAWLYSSNGLGATNYDTLRECVKQSKVFGECGLWLDGDELRAIHKGYYACVVKQEYGNKYVVAYLVRKDGEMVDPSIDQTSIYAILSGQTVEQVIDSYTTSGYMVIDTDHFVNVRNDTSYIHGSSPLLSDIQRLTLLIAVYQRLNVDINYDGPGRIILRPKDGYYEGGANPVSTTEVMNQSGMAQNDRYQKARLEAKRVAKQIKDSSSDSVILLSNAFSENVKELPRVTKATEFFSWISNACEIIAQDMGMRPVLVDAGETNGNISMESRIDDAILNSIIPQREKYSIQFSKMISSHIGVTKIFFDKYSLQQIQDTNDERLKISNMVASLSSSYAKNPNEDIQKVINHMLEMLDTSLMSDDGEDVRPLMSN